jgi:REP-associated tyrosine transposase
MTAEASSPRTPRKERLQRLDRLFVASPIYFVTACAAKRRAILACPEVHRAFLEYASQGEERGAFVGAYVLMPDHLHLFVALAPELTLSGWMKSLKNQLSKALRALGVEAPHWQKGFFDHVLRSGDSYSQKWDYVRDNPVRAGWSEVGTNGLSAARCTFWNIGNNWVLRRDLEIQRSFGGHRPPLQGAL